MRHSIRILYDIDSVIHKLPSVVINTAVIVKLMMIFRSRWAIHAKVEQSQGGLPQPLLLVELPDLVQQHAELPPDHCKCQSVWSLYRHVYHCKHHLPCRRSSRCRWQLEKCPVDWQFRFFCSFKSNPHWLTPVFTYIFAAEAFLKILALGFITYLKDPWNTFDFVIVIISISDVLISLTSPDNGENQNSGLNVLRTLRTGPWKLSSQNVDYT